MGVEWGPRHLQGHLRGREGKGCLLVLWFEHASSQACGHLTGGRLAHGHACSCPLSRWELFQTGRRASMPAGWMGGWVDACGNKRMVYHLLPHPVAQGSRLGLCLSSVNEPGALLLSGVTGHRPGEWCVP